MNIWSCVHSKCVKSETICCICKGPGPGGIHSECCPMPSLASLISSQTACCQAARPASPGFYELRNQAFENSTFLLLGLPIPHAIYLIATQSTCAQSNIMGDASLTKSSQAAETRETRHTLLAHEFNKIANKCGVPMTCNHIGTNTHETAWESKKIWWLLCNCGVTPNAILNFHRTSH